MAKKEETASAALNGPEPDEDEVLEPVVVIETADKADGGRRPRRQQPTRRRLEAARKYASGEAPSVRAALISAGYSPRGIAHNPAARGAGPLDLVKLDATYNTPPATPGEMLRSGLGVLHELAVDKAQAPGVRGSAASALVQRLNDTGLANAEENVRTLRDNAQFLADLLVLVRHGARLGARLGDRAVELIEDRLRMLPEPTDAFQDHEKPRLPFGYAKSLRVLAGETLALQRPRLRADATTGRKLFEGKLTIPTDGEEAGSWTPRPRAENEL